MRYDPGADVSHREQGEREEQHRDHGCDVVEAGGHGVPRPAAVLGVGHDEQAVHADHHSANAAEDAEDPGDVG